MGHNTCPTCRELIDPDVSEDEDEEDENEELSDEMLDDLREMIIYFLLEE